LELEIKRLIAGDDMGNKTKCLHVDEEVWEFVMSLKIRKKYRTVNDVLRELLGLNTAKAIEMQVKQEVKQEAKQEKKESKQEKKEEKRPLFGLSRPLF